jgi:hypothetical protein
VFTGLGRPPLGLADRGLRRRRVSEKRDSVPAPSTVDGLRSPSLAVSDVLIALHEGEHGVKLEQTASTTRRPGSLSRGPCIKGSRSAFSARSEELSC